MTPKLPIRYELDSELPVNSGGCGVLWRATDRLTREPVAVKTIKISDHGISSKARRSFMLEAVAAARLSKISLHILPSIDFGELEGELFIVYPWLAGEGGPDIGGLVGRCTLFDAKVIGLAISDALDTAHSNGIVHSDVAPWNILKSTETQRYMLGDFGLLKLIESDLITEPSGSLLRGGRQQFLPAYALRDISRVSPASDIYALARTLWCLVSGRDVLLGGDEVPGVVDVRRDAADAPHAFRSLLNRFITGHSPSDTANEFRMFLERVPAA